MMDLERILEDEEKGRSYIQKLLSDLSLNRSKGYGTALSLPSAEEHLPNGFTLKRTYSAHKLLHRIHFPHTEEGPKESYFDGGWINNWIPKKGDTSVSSIPVKIPVTEHIEHGTSIIRKNEMYILGFRIPRSELERKVR